MPEDSGPTRPGTSPEQVALRRRRRAQQLRVPEALLKRRQPTDERRSHRELPRTDDADPDRGACPQLLRLLHFAGQNSLKGVRPEQLVTRRPRDQVEALAKDHYYDRLAPFLKGLWGDVRQWRDDKGEMLAELHEERADDGRFIYELTPLSDASRQRLRAAESVREALARTLHHKRCLWFGLLMSRVASDEALRRDQPPRTHVPARPRTTTAELVWNGINTALKVMSLSTLALRELYADRHGEDPDPATWRAMLDAHYRFLALMASMNLETFDPLEAGLLTEAEATAGSPAAPTDEADRQAFFDLSKLTLHEEGGVPCLDLSETYVDELIASGIGASVLTKHCPAMRIGLIQEMYAEQLACVSGYVDLRTLTVHS